MTVVEEEEAKSAANPEKSTCDSEKSDIKPAESPKNFEAENSEKSEVKPVGNLVKSPTKTTQVNLYNVALLIFLYIVYPHECI